MPFSSPHRGSKYNARGKPIAAEVCVMKSHCNYLCGAKHSEGLRLARLPAWKTVETDYRTPPERPRNTFSQRPWEQLNWEHTILDLRNHPSRTPRYSRREVAWNATHSVSVSKGNAHLPRGERSYFGQMRELDSDGVIMSPASSSVWRREKEPARRRNDLSSWIEPYGEGMSRPSTAATRSSFVSANANRPVTSPPSEMPNQPSS